MSKVFITRPMTAEVEARAREVFDVEIRAKTSVMEPPEMCDVLREFDCIVPTLGDLFSAEVLAAAGDIRCKLLANFGVGYNHIDVAAAKAAGIAVTNTPGAVTDATADIAMMLILMSARRASEGERLVRAGAWQGWHPTQLLGQHVGGKRVGILGMGRIGQAIAHRCHYGFGMKISYVARSEKSLPHPATFMNSVVDLAREVDFLVLAVPGGAETRHLINAEILAAMPQHAHLINIARGEVVEEAALIVALQSGQIAGAGLDVYEFEPKIPEALTGLNNVTLLPHLGTAAEEVRSGMGHMALDNVFAHLTGMTLPNLVV
ncbi:2-hydroxyacid dehydrogenase [Epibacterium ulvae]|uniref:2-hydroxyacid dehydrogenase n=1 Tax=Epibacterium ulvae TaxID=1156985 RepID=UPI0024928B94|nr:D-glycerate dehydrogenase [Epibacterium ulvae]